MKQDFSVRGFLMVAGMSALTVAGAQNLAVKATPSAPAKPAPKAVSTGVEPVTALPLRRISLYKSGVGFFEQAGTVTGDELVQIDLTTAQLNDALNSLTAVDLGKGTVVGGGYDAATSVNGSTLALQAKLGADPTVVDFLRVMKGARVEVHAGVTVFAGRLMNVEVRRQPGLKLEQLVEKRYVTVLGDSGGMRSFELTPSVEVRLVGEERREIGHYLASLASPQQPGVRHLTLEDRGAGTRELQLSYLSAVPAWKSTYRFLMTDDARIPQMATLQGWAVVDNTSATDWNDVQLTLVSGAPQSFMQQISRPVQVQRPEIAVPIAGASVPEPVKLDRMRAGLEPLPQGQSVPLAGVGGVQVAQAVAAPQMQQAKFVSDAANYEDAARETMAHDTKPLSTDDLFEYRLSKPVTIRRNQSAMVPLLEADVQAKRVTYWNATNKTHVQRAVWLLNTSNLTLDRGSFSLVENGAFAGQGQMELVHPNERVMLPYAEDDAVEVVYLATHDVKPYPRRINAQDGTLSVHRRAGKERDFDIVNHAATLRDVVLEYPKTPDMELSPTTPAIQRAETAYFFEKDAAPNATTRFKIIETHSHPTHYDLVKMDLAELRGILKESGVSQEIVNDLQPIVDAKQRVAEIDQKVKVDEDAIHHVAEEEMRIRKNLAAMKATGEDSDISKRYQSEMLAQEDKLAVTRKDMDGLHQQRDVAVKALEAVVLPFKMNVVIVP